MNAVKCRLNAFLFCVLKKQEKTMNSENLIKKSSFALTIIALLMMVCLCACTVSSGVPSVERVLKLENIDEKTEIMNQKNIQELNVENSETDTKAPEGILKGNFLVAWERVIPGDFVEKVTDSSEFTEGFRNIRLIYSAEKAEEILKKALGKVDITREEIDFIEIFHLNWDASKDCFEEQDVKECVFEKYFEPKENGLYEMEVVAADVFGNASVAKVFVLYDSKTMTRAELKNYVEEQISQKSVLQQSENGLNRAKAEEAFAQVNAKRVENGVEMLVWDEGLYELASIRAQEIVGKFSHERPDGSYVGDVMIGQYGLSGCGENIAANYTSVTNLVNGWMNSDGHRENLLNGQFRAGVMACYCHNGSCYWVNLFRQ